MVADAEMFKVQDIYWESRPVRRRRKQEGQRRSSVVTQTLQSSDNHMGTQEQMLLIRVTPLSGQNGQMVTSPPHCIQSDPKRA